MILGVRKIKSWPLYSSITFFLIFFYFFPYLCEQNSPQRGLVAGVLAGGLSAGSWLQEVRIRIQHVFFTDGVVREDFSPFPLL